MKKVFKWVIIVVISLIVLLGGAILGKYIYERATREEEANASVVPPAEKTSITVKTASASFVYAGVPQCKNGASDYSVDGEVADGHTISVVITGSITDVGVAQNTFTYGIKDSEGKDVSEHYNVNSEPGTLSVTPCPYQVSVGNLSKIYDGKPLNGAESEIQTVGLVSGHRIDRAHSIFETITRAGEKENTVVLSIQDADGRDVTKNYQFDGYIQKGRLKVEPLTIEVVTDTARGNTSLGVLIASGYTVNYTYDGNAVSDDTGESDAALLLETGDKLYVTVTGKQEGSGSSSNTVDAERISLYNAQGEDVTFCYSVTLTLGTLTLVSR